MLNKKYLVIVAAIVILGGVIYGASVSRSPMITVRLGEIQLGDISSYLSTTATVKSKDVKEYYGLQAKIEEVHVEIGDSVKKGDPLISYEKQDIETTVKQAEIQYENAILQRDQIVNQNQEIQEKIEELEEQISILRRSGADVNALKQQRDSLKPISSEGLKQAENSISLAKLNLDAARKRLSQNKSSLVAENDGVVTQLNAIEGAIGNSMQPAVVVQNIEALKAVAAVGKYDAEKITMGQRVIVKTGNREYEGRISFIDPVARKSSAPTGGETTLGIEIDILEAAPELKIDFDVDIDILLGEAKEVLKLPAEAIKVDKSGKYQVFVVENNVAKERQVVIGLQSDTEVQVLEGLKAGEKVILNPGGAIEEGVQVVAAQEGQR